MKSKTTDTIITKEAYQTRWAALPSLRKLGFYENIGGNMVAVVGMEQVLEAAEADVKAAVAKKVEEYEARLERLRSGV